MTTHREPTPEQLQGMIYQVYEKTPHADTRRLEAIEHRVRPSRTITCKPRSRTPWWMAGLVLVASGAAAWWVIHSNTKQESIVPEEAMSRSLPAQQPQAIDAIQLHQAAPSETQETATVEAAVNDQKLSQSPADKGESTPKSPRIIFQRETF